MRVFDWYSCGQQTVTLTNYLSQIDSTAKVCVRVLTALVSEAKPSR